MDPKKGLLSMAMATPPAMLTQEEHCRKGVGAPKIIY